MPSLRDGRLQGNDNDSDIYFNPFAESSQTSFTSAVKPKDTRVETRPGFRRRGSESAAQRSRTDHDPWNAASESMRVHGRASTMDSVTGSRTKAHPLASTTGPLKASGGSSQSSLVDTRPSLKRLLSDMDPSPSRGERSSEDSLPSTSKDADVKEAMVIVHEVSPKDSLAGVALKYGISMADLRRANHLWTSDLIYLRKVLYIPIDKAHKAKHLVLSQLETASESGSRTDLLDTTPGSNGDNRALSPPPNSSSSLTIRRVPVSKLSFFPPSSTSHFVPSRSDTTSRTLPRSSGAFTRDPIPFQLTPSSSSAHSDTSSSSVPPSSIFGTALQSQLHSTTSSSRPHIPSLASLFNSLPLPLPRLSFDSGTSTPTQASDEQEHELVDVGSHDRERRAHDSRHCQYEEPRAPKLNLIGGPAKTAAVELDLYPFKPTSSASRSLGSEFVPRTPPKQHSVAAYVTPERNTLAPESVRTSQLEPSPSMQLPLRSRRDRDVER